jgi:hypothetical protein
MDLDSTGKDAGSSSSLVFEFWWRLFFSLLSTQWLDHHALPLALVFPSPQWLNSLLEPPRKVTSLWNTQEKAHEVMNISVIFLFFLFKAEDCNQGGQGRGVGTRIQIKYYVL